MSMGGHHWMGVMGLFAANEIKKGKEMEKALHIRTTVMPGGKIEIMDQGLPVGSPYVIFPNSRFESAYSIWGHSTLGLLSYWWHSSRSNRARPT